MKRAALIVGINRYQDSSISRLLCAEKDAVALEFFLRDRCGFVVTSLINDQATKHRINDAVRQLCAELGPEDVFLFYFAGHGHDDPHTRQQVLLPVDVRLQDIEDQLQPDLVPVRGLESATARCGASRFFMLDACRIPLPAGSRDSSVRCRDVVTADMKSMVEEECKSNPPLVLVHSCSPNQRAHEIESLGRGVFSKALEEMMWSHVSEGRELSLPGQALEEIADRTARLLREYRQTGRQDPMISANRGRITMIKAAGAEESVQPQVDAGGWQNSLGMKFAVMAEAKVLMCLFPTRVSDYRTFADEVTIAWPRPEFEQGPDHPAVLVSWEDARCFCLWLTERESKAGLLKARQRYRLPTDSEWSLAAGLRMETEQTPEQRGISGGVIYSWGSEWQPPGNTWNFGYVNYGTIPIEASQANALGLLSLSGNVWEWCEERYSETDEERALRGGSWRSVRRESLSLTCRIGRNPSCRSDDIGFRVVLESHPSDEDDMMISSWTADG